MVRGWLECSFENVERIKIICDGSWSRFTDFGLDKSRADLYWKGWNFPACPINWVSFIFYGASVNVIAYDLIHQVLVDIAASDFELKGFFQVDDDEGEESFALKIESGEVLRR